MDDTESLSYPDLIRIADQILERGEDRPEILAEELDRLPHGIRGDLLTSDLLNAFQVFYYYYREDPGDLARDRLTLQPASALANGVMMVEIDLLEVIFSVEAGEPVCAIGDGEQVLARCRGKASYKRALRYLDELL